MRVLIAGKDGQLGREFVKRLAAPEFEVEAPDEKTFDITDREAVRAIISRFPAGRTHQLRGLQSGR